MNQKQVSKKEIEKLLFQKIRDIYINKLEHNLDSIYYKQFDRTLILILEGSVTSTEIILDNSECKPLARQLRTAIDKIVQPQIKTIIEQVMGVKIIDFFIDTTISNNLTGAIAIFELEERDISQQ